MESCAEPGGVSSGRSEMAGRSSRLLLKPPTAPASAGSGGADVHAVLRIRGHLTPHRKNRRSWLRRHQKCYFVQHLFGHRCSAVGSSARPHGPVPVRHFAALRVLCGPGRYHSFDTAHYAAGLPQAHRPHGRAAVPEWDGVHADGVRAHPWGSPSPDRTGKGSRRNRSRQPWMWCSDAGRLIRVHAERLFPALWLRGSHVCGA